MHSLEPYQERIIIERDDLSISFSKLQSFIEGESFEAVDPHEQNRLIRQRNIMEQYLDILDDRINNFL